MDSDEKLHISNNLCGLIDSITHSNELLAILKQEKCLNNEELSKLVNKPTWVGPGTFSGMELLVFSCPVEIYRSRNGPYPKILFKATLRKPLIWNHQFPTCICPQISFIPNAFYVMHFSRISLIPNAFPHERQLSPSRISGSHIYP